MGDFRPPLGAACCGRPGSASGARGAFRAVRGLVCRPRALRRAIRDAGALKGAAPLGPPSGPGEMGGIRPPSRQGVAVLPHTPNSAHLVLLRAAWMSTCHPLLVPLRLLPFSSSTASTSTSPTHQPARGSFCNRPLRRNFLMCCRLPANRGVSGVAQHESTSTRTTQYSTHPPRPPAARTRCLYRGAHWLAAAMGVTGARAPPGGGLQGGVKLVRPHRL
jgi:hypothetical protein